jgi:hypothetical protein
MQQQNLLPDKPLSYRASELLKLCQEPIEFINLFNYDFCRNRYLEYNTVKKALTSNIIKLSEISSAYSKETIILFLQAWLVNLSVYSGMDADEFLLKDISNELYSEIFMFNLSELTLLFSGIKKGSYGEFYGRFDGMKILIAARGYRAKRGIIFSNLTSEEQKQLI